MGRLFSAAVWAVSGLKRLPVCVCLCVCLCFFSLFSSYFLFLFVWSEIYGDFVKTCELQGAARGSDVILGFLLELGSYLAHICLIFNSDDGVQSERKTNAYINKCPHNCR